MYSTFVNVPKSIGVAFYLLFELYFFSFFFNILLYQFDTNARKYEGYQYNQKKNRKKILGLLIYNILYSITTSKFTI